MALAGLTPQGMTATKQEQTPAAGMTGLSISPLAFSPQQQVSGWLSPDMRAATINWGLFNDLPEINYANLLRSNYDEQPSFIKPGDGINYYAARDENARIARTLPGASGLTPSALSYKDPVAQRAIQAINDKIYGIQEWRNPEKTGTIADYAARPYLANVYDRNSYMKTTPLETVYGKNDDSRASFLASIANETGLTVDDLTKYYGQYSKAYNALSDPVGANWQDFKNSGNLYIKSLLPGIRSWSGYDDGYFSELEKLASEGTRNSQKYLSPEYFILHGLTPENQYRSKHLGKQRSLANPVFGTGKKAIDRGYSNPYALQDYTDYLNDEINRLTASDDDITRANEAMALHNKQLSSKVEDGGMFNLWREAGMNPYQVTKTKGGKWLPKNSAYTNKLNAAQNYLSLATEGQKNFQDIGYDPEAAWRDQFYFDKKKKKGLFGGGLGTILSLASFIPGPIGLGARLATTLNSVASGDVLGSIMGAAGVAGKMGFANPITAATGKLSSALNISPKLATAIVQGGIGGLGAMQGGGNFARGALGAGLGSFAGGEIGDRLARSGMSPQMSGVLSGLSSSAINAGINKQNGLPLALSLASGAISGYGRGSEAEKRRKAAEQRRLRNG